MNSGPGGVDQTWTSEGGSDDPVETLSADPKSAVLAELYLRACAAGAPCNDLAVALATAVLEDDAIRLAVAVLESDEHRLARATELAERVLNAASNDAGSRSERKGHG